MHTRLSTIANIFKWEASRGSHVSTEISANNDTRHQRGHHDASEDVTETVNQHTGSICIGRGLRLTRLASHRPINDILDRLNVFIQDWGRVSGVPSLPGGSVTKHHAIHRPRTSLHQEHERNDHPWPPIQTDEHYHSEPHQRRRRSRNPSPKGPALLDLRRDGWEQENISHRGAAMICDCEMRPRVILTRCIKRTQLESTWVSCRAQGT